LELCAFYAANIFYARIKMLRLYLIIALSLLSACSTTSYKQPYFAKNIDKILAESDLNKSTKFAVYAVKLADNSVLYDRDSSHLMIPASVVKMITAYNALSYLGPDFIYKTELRLDPVNPDKKGNFPGNIYLKFNGNPTLTSEDFNLLIQQLANNNIKRIKGDIIIDDEAFDAVPYGPGWAWDDNNFCYMTPITPMVIDHNCFPMQAIPADAADKPLNVVSKTFNMAHIINQAITGSDSFDCELDLTSTSDNTYTFSGCLSVGSKALNMNIAYQNPRKYAHDLLKKVLGQNKIKYGKIQFKKTPDNLHLFAIHNSPPLSQIIKIMLKDSDNLIAEIALKTIGSKLHNSQGNFDNGINAEHALLGQYMDFNSMRIVDGSGTSRYNLASPKHFVQFLQIVYEDTNLSKLFIDSLPTASVDGSLKNRFLSFPDLRSKIWAKTGGLNGVTNLAGYLLSESNGMIAFSIMINGNIGSNDSAKELQDKILAVLSS
jgi:D-alanyl-D-alanine carboxypeptidase/D-alanyl-D-alanine-endopeptidase (penicillin-binding protein 4)